MKLDIMVFSAHPDDAELGCGGTMSQATHRGRSVGVIDMTRGELSTRGSVSIRDKEATAAAKILGLSVRENLGFRDGFFTADETHQLAVIRKIRKYRPDIILAGAPNDRHPDHPRAASLIAEATFISGLRKVKTEENDKAQEPWRPRVLYHYIQSILLRPDFVVDVSQHWETKMKAISAYQSQFFGGDKEPETYITNPMFLRMIESRGVEFGHSIGATYGEGFITTRNLGVKDLFHLL